MEDSITILESHEQQSMIEIEETEKHTFDGSVDWKGAPAIKDKSGGWKVGILILVNQILATAAFFGIGVNLVLFMTRILEQDNAEAANNVSTWTGTAYMFSLVGALLGDSYWGRYKTCAFFQIIFVSGLLELSLSSYLLLLKPCVPGIDNPQCEPPKHTEILIFYISLYQIALGSGAYQPSITTFGADQFDEEDPAELHSKVAFFSYFYFANNIGTLFSNTIIAYIENKKEWVLAFWLTSGAGVLALIIFLSGTSRYRHFKPRGNPLTRICQVVVAAIKKRKISTPISEDHLYEVEGRNAMNGGRKILHTPSFKFLDHAAAVPLSNSPGDHNYSPWSLCTITQVEEVKCMIRLLPIWFCTVIYAVAYTQMSSVFVEQGAAMKNSISSFHIPPASISIFEILSVGIFVFIDRLYIVPLLSKQLNRTPEKGTELHRMGLGLVLVLITMVAAGLVENQRIRHAIKDTSSLTILWQIPQYVIMGASEAFMYVSQLEFFNSQAPDGLKSFGSALSMASVSVGNYLSSLIVVMVMGITGRGDRVGWISDNLNAGHMDRFFFLLAMLVGVDLVMFVICAKYYRYISLGGRPDIEESNDEVLEIEM